MDKSKIHILLVEDDPNLGVVVRDYFKISGYNIFLADNGKIAWEAFIANKFDLCIIDIMLPEMDGFTLAGKIRERDENSPILFLTAKSASEDKIKGFRLGADDYIIKPFNIEELVLRVEVFLKRSQNNVLPKSVFTIGKYLFDSRNLILSFENNHRNLTQKESDLLKKLCIHQGTALKREEILNSIWGNDDYFTGRSLDVFVSRLRKYLKDDLRVEIQNLHSVGFRLMIKQ